MKESSVDKEFCMSSYLAFRYIENRSKNFSQHVIHKVIPSISDSQRILVKTESDINHTIDLQIRNIKAKYKKIGLFLSGGMDSAILASYLRGCDAYTFRTNVAGNVFKGELKEQLFLQNIMD